MVLIPVVSKCYECEVALSWLRPTQRQQLRGEYWWPTERLFGGSILSFVYCNVFYRGSLKIKRGLREKMPSCLFFVCRTDVTLKDISPRQRDTTIKGSMISSTQVPVKQSCERKRWKSDTKVVMNREAMSWLMYKTLPANHVHFKHAFSPWGGILRSEFVAHIQFRDFLSPG